MNTPQVKPVVGQGATRLMYSDRHACTVIDISESGKTVTVQDDTATRIDSNGQSDAQEYSYTQNPQGEITKFRFTKKGWTACGQSLLLGERDEYYDFSF